MSHDTLKLIKNALLGFIAGILVAAAFINNLRLNEIQVRLMCIEQLVRLNNENICMD